MLKNKVFELLHTNDMDIVRDLFHGELTENTRWDSDEQTEFRAAVLCAGLTFKFVDRYGGEGEGENYWSVYSFSDGNEVVFIKFDGYYASYEGATFDELYEVKAVEKTITVFEKK